MNTLVCLESQGKTQPWNFDLLILETDQPAFDGMSLKIKIASKLKVLRRKICIKFMINASKQIQIESCRYLGVIVVSALHHIDILYQIETYQNPITLR